MVISQEAYDEYRQKKEAVSNTRLRPENQTFIDALQSTDMTATAEGVEILEVIKKVLLIVMMRFVKKNQ